MAHCSSAVKQAIKFQTVIFYSLIIQQNKTAIIKQSAIMLVKKNRTLLFLGIICYALCTGLLPARALAQADTIPAYKVFLVGDAGEHLFNGKDALLQLLHQHLKEADSNNAILFLGDNIYPVGMPMPGAKGRAEAERRIKEVLDIVKDFPGKIFFIPGNHDWENGKKTGWQQLKQQEQFIEQYLQRGNVFLPDDGCPGPVEVSLNSKTTLIIMDTQWWLHPWDKPGRESACETKTEDEVLTELDDILYRNRHKQVIVAAHHPMYGYGKHFGYATVEDHLFPLTNLSKALYIPLPVIGSIYPVYRRVLGNVQDMHHPRYRLMQEQMVKLLKKYPGAIYTNGHDHNLQYVISDSVNYITSGSGSKNDPVTRKAKTRYASNRSGFGELRFFANGINTLVFHEANIPVHTFPLVVAPRPAITEGTIARINIPEGQTVRVAAGKRYVSSGFNQFIMGKNYRKEWAQELTIPVFDISKEKGGLKVLKRGGGKQTRSIRLEDKTGKEWVLRSIDKDPTKAIPPFLRESGLAGDIVQDQISAAHPFSFLVVPPLAEAIGVPHANPKVVFIPNDPAFEPYTRLVGNTLALFEERNPGESETGKSYNTEKVLEKLKEDNDNAINQSDVLKARLFDIFIADFDRHDDQWRWVADKTKKGLTYSPVPRDRDQAFFVNEGIIPRLASKDWLVPSIQGFRRKTRNVSTFMFSGAFFDRSFMNELSRDQWKDMALYMQQQLTDKVIEYAGQQLPDSMFRFRGAEIISKLKSKRDELAKEADTYYRFLAKNIDITGSDKREYFKVERISNQHTSLKVYKINKDGDTAKILYSRIFKRDETKEIRLYGQGGDDVFHVSGNTAKGIKVRIIGGEGKDSITDLSQVSGLGKKTIIYDTEEGNAIQGGSETKNLSAADPRINDYNRKVFKYDKLQPVFSFQFNPDDGLFLGAKLLIQKQGFRKSPFALQHKISINHATATDAWNFDYQGDFIHVFGKTDIQLNIEYKSPSFVDNFFGLGNETPYLFKGRDGFDYYRVRLQNKSANILLRRRLNPSQSFYIGPELRTVDVESSPNRIITDFGFTGLNNTIFNTKRYVGLLAGYSIDNRDHKMLPTQGVVWNTNISLLRGLGKASGDLTQVQSDLAFYYSTRLPSVITFALRFGGGINSGDYEFFQANRLGGLTNLRGYRRSRFAGDQSFFTNGEVRLKLLDFRSYLFPASFGILGFADAGRVWLKGENSDTWHSAVGGGIWIAPLRQFVISITGAHSKEETLIVNVKGGFFF
jgi:Omp85 superfamily domain/Calcineurin-like phosphoesterase